MQEPPATTRRTRTLGERLAYARMLTAGRLQPRLTATALALLCDLSSSHVRQIEAGTLRDTGAAVVGRLCDVLGISADWLISERDPAPEADAVVAAVQAARAAQAQREADQRATG